MRIVAGSARGRVLAAPKSDDVIRPTADRVRESIFNVLGQRCDGLCVLDLFAGTGALGLEAVSRGALRAVLVDRAREALALCQQNVNALRFADRVEIVACDVTAAFSRLKGQSFELVFADPPYRLEAGLSVLEGLAQAELVSPGGIVVVETGLTEQLPGQHEYFEQIDQRFFGATSVWFFRRR